MKKILAIVGSLRKGSYNRQLAGVVGKKLEGRADFKILEYSDLKLLNQDDEFPEPETVKRIRDEVRASDALWIFCPEYNHFFSGPLKNVIDWLSRPVNGVNNPILQKMPVAISGVSPGSNGTALAQDHLVTLLSFLNLDIMNERRLTIAGAKEDEDGKVDFFKSESYIDKQIEAFLKYIER